MRETIKLLEKGEEEKQTYLDSSSIWPTHY